MRIAVIGTGYVGLVSGACFAELGMTVTCVDKDAAKIARLNNGEVPIYEPGLGDVISRNRAAGRLTFSTNVQESARSAEAVFIAVGTPPHHAYGHADLSHVYAVATEIAQALTSHTIVVVKSTVPVGTCQEVSRLIGEACPNASFEVVSNPEFLREGSAIEDFMNPERLIVGARSDDACATMRRLYQPLAAAGKPIMFTSPEASELIKYAANAFLAVKVAFINEIADLCERVGADVGHVARGIGLDSRIGAAFLKPGPGYGGSCLPKDTSALVEMAKTAGTPLRTVAAAVEANAKRKATMADRIVAFVGGNVCGKTIAVLGLTFKPNTDDVRASPALDIVQALVKKGARVQVCDPQGLREAAQVLGDGPVYCDDAYAALQAAVAAVIVTEWHQFQNLDLARAKQLMAEPAIIDLRNVYAPAAVRAAGYRYQSVGRSC